MRIEPQVFEDCPNLEPAWVLAALRRAQDSEAHHLPGLANRTGCEADGPEPGAGAEDHLPKAGLKGAAQEGPHEGARAMEGPSHACCTPLAKPKAAASCPACGVEGKLVYPVTLRALLQPHLRPEVKEEVYRFCANPECDLVYFSADGSQTFARADLTVRVGVKERSGPRPLCYCFGHSAESIQHEWTTTRKSTVIDAIKAEVRAETCCCEVTNPGGGCCLGDIIKEVKALTASPVPPAQDCRAPSKPACG